MRWLISVSISRAAVEGLCFIGLELLDVVHGNNRNIERYCSTWNMLRY